MSLKRCCKCYEFKPYEAFHRDRSTKDGRNSICKVCRKPMNQKNAVSWKSKPSKSDPLKTNQEVLAEYQRDYNHTVRKENLEGVHENRRKARIRSRLKTEQRDMESDSQFVENIETLINQTKGKEK